MRLKIRCPHCHKVLVADDQTAGERKLCPACGREFTVPMPVPAEPAAHNFAERCPHCSAEIAPGTAVCPKCLTDLTTGKRLPLKQRLARVSLKAWTVAAALAVVLVLAATVGIQLYLTHATRSVPHASTTPAVASSPVAAAEWADRLLAATDATERRTARDKLLHSGRTANAGRAEAVADALERSLDRTAPDFNLAENQRAALDVLARTAGADGEALARFAPLLAKCRRVATLADAACRTRALLGDAEAFDDLRGLWTSALRRVIFFTRLTAVAELDKDPSTSAVLARARARTAFFADSLRQLGEKNESEAFDKLLETYWVSWSWLGQVRGAVVADELFKLVQPAEAAGSSAGRERDAAAIRGSREVLSRMGQRALPLARAAAGLVLAQVVPQEAAERERIANSLPALIPACPAPAQQQLVWTLARLTGRQFGDATARSLPEQVRREDIEAALRWGRSKGLVDATVPATLAEAYPAPPALTHRVISPERQLERELLGQLQQDWAQATPALEDWLDADLGCTPRLLSLLDPRQQRPHYPALAAAMVVVAECGDADVRRTLALWREAPDQPVWVQQLAYMSLGALDARRGKWESGWPAGLQLGWLERGGVGQPGWRYVGQILAAGGKPMLKRLQSQSPQALPRELTSKLTAAAEDAARRREAGRER